MFPLGSQARRRAKICLLYTSDTPKVTDTLIELFKIDMETQKDNPQGNASLEGAEFTWKYYAGFYNKDNLPAEATRTWVTKTIAETDSDGTTHYITKLADAYKVSEMCIRDRSIQQTGMSRKRWNTGGSSGRLPLIQNLATI